MSTLSRTDSADYESHASQSTLDELSDTHSIGSTDTFDDPDARELIPGPKDAVKGAQNCFSQCFNFEYVIISVSHSPYLHLWTTRNTSSRTPPHAHQRYWRHRSRAANGAWTRQNWMKMQGWLARPMPLHPPKSRRVCPKRYFCPAMNVILRDM